jgi:hypothetical protein
MGTHRDAGWCVGSGNRSVAHIFGNSGALSQRGGVTLGGVEWKSLSVPRVLPRTPTTRVDAARLPQPYTTQKNRKARRE